MKLNHKILIHTCSILFFCLCLFHFASQRPLWLDETFVYKNFLNHGYLDLFGPLNPVQSFPRLYLVIIKAISAPFDHHVLALRALSLLSMLAAFFILKKIILADSRDGFSALLIMFAICASYKFSYYGAELKPYSMDVLVIAFYALYLHYQRVFEYMEPARKDYLAAALLPFLIFFSYASLFVFWLVTFNFLLQLRKNKSVWRILGLNGTLSIICFLIFYFVDIRHSITQPGVDYWDGHFICYSSFECFWDKFGDGIRRMVIYPFDGIKIQRYAASVFIPFFVFATCTYGVKRLFKDKCQIYHSDALTLLLVVELFIVSSFQLYPFTGERLTLFLSPFVIYMVVKGLMGFLKWPKLRRIILGYYLLFYLTCLISTVYKHLQYHLS